MMIGLHGPLGSSKTWGIVYLADWHQKHGFKIWSDTPLNREYFPDYVNLNTDPRINFDYIQRSVVNGDPFPYEDIYMGLDEWQYRADSRTSMSSDSRFFSYLYNQTRKRGIVVAYSSRMRGYVDLRARDAEDLIIRCFKKHKSNGRQCYNHKCEQPHFFEWWVIDQDNNLSKKIRFRNPEWVFPMYQTKSLETGLIAR